MIISISGIPGAGKTTAGKELAKRLGYQHYYMGDIRRKKAAEIGMTLEEYNKYGEKDFSTDKNVDEYITQLGKTEDNFVIESRTAFHFIPHSVKIFLSISEAEGAKRIFHELQSKEGKDRNEARGIASLEDMKRSIRKRLSSDTIRYKKYYDLNPFDPSHYDLIIDTTHSTPEKTVQQIMDFLLKVKE